MIKKGMMKEEILWIKNKINNNNNKILSLFIILCIIIII